MATPNTIIPKLKIWMEQALSWLHADGNLKDVVQKPHRQLLEIMEASRTANRPNEVWETIDELERLAPGMPHLEQGEVFTRCAVMATELENLKDSLRLLQAAENKYKTSPHQDAVVLWMIGCIHWVNGQKVEGVSSWQSTISLFVDRKLKAQVDPKKSQWYVDKLPQLEEYLAEAIRIGQLPPFLSTATSTTVPPSETETPTQPFSFDGDSLCWVSCQISESIPAGGFGPTGFDPNPLGFLEISEVLIDDEPYQVFSVRRQSIRRNVINISSQSQYKTVQVTGTSMNAARPVPIETGDYVLLQAVPNVGDNEIVVAGIFGQDERATVKRLRRRNGKIQLIPESTDPTNYEIDWEKEFNALDDEFRIIGVVEAIFKKKPC